jgi:hypothetical protein
MRKLEKAGDKVGLNFVFCVFLVHCNEIFSLEFTERKSAYIR